MRLGVDHADHDGTDLILEALLLSDRVGWVGGEFGIWDSMELGMELWEFQIFYMVGWMQDFCSNLSEQYCMGMEFESDIRADGEALKGHGTGS